MALCSAVDVADPPFGYSAMLLPSSRRTETIVLVLDRRQAAPSGMREQAVSSIRIVHPPKLVGLARIRISSRGTRLDCDILYSSTLRPLSVRATSPSRARSSSAESCAGGSLRLSRIARTRSSGCGAYQTDQTQAKDFDWTALPQLEDAHVAAGASCRFRWVRYRRPAVS